MDSTLICFRQTYHLTFRDAVVDPGTFTLIQDVFLVAQILR